MSDHISSNAPGKRPPRRTTIARRITAAAAAALLVPIWLTSAQSAPPAPGASAQAPAAAAPAPATTSEARQPAAGVAPASSTTQVVAMATSALFVATTGSDSNPGTQAKPLRTVAKAAAIAAPGVTVYLRAGTYAGFDVTRSGITFSAYPGEKAVVRDSSRDDVIQFTGVSSGTIQRLVVRGSRVAYGSAIKIKDSSGVIVRNSTVRDNRTFGIVIVRSSHVRILRNNITGNADGIEERYAGNGVVIAHNRIHDNTKMVDSGRGMEGINFYKSTGRIDVKYNRLWNNGTHFEVYGASNLHITRNVTWNGQIMETGTDGLACANNRFIRNIGYKGSGFQGGETNGLILRCARNMLVAHNTLDGFDLFAFDIVDGSHGVAYGGSIEKLRILNNIVVGGRAFSIDSALPTSVNIDYNLVYNAGSTATYGNHIAYVKNVGQFDTLSSFRSATGYEKHGKYGNPRFQNQSAHNYHLRPTSPAIDAGTVVLGGSYAGTAPDMGRFEAG